MSDPTCQHGMPPEEYCSDCKKLSDLIEKIERGELPAVQVKITRGGGWSELNSLKHDVSCMLWFAMVIIALLAGILFTLWYRF